jgi:hypothetical protein
VKNLLLILSTGGSVAWAFAAVPELLLSSVAHWETWRPWLYSVCVVALAFSTLFFWAQRLRFSWPVVVSQSFFGVFSIDLLLGCIRAENYDGPTVLAFLIAMALLPFIAVAAVFSFSAPPRESQIA